MAVSMQAYVSSHSMMTDCGLIHCRLHIPQITPDTTSLKFKDVKVYSRPAIIKCII